MKEIVVYPPETKVSHDNIVWTMRCPIGLLTSTNVKFLVWFDNKTKFVIKRVDSLNTDGSFETSYPSLKTLVEKEVAMGETLFLFDSWKEFYLWCAE